MIIRAKTFKAWMRANFDREQLLELAEHGADSGWTGLTYYSDTVKLYEKFKEEIWDMLNECAEACGYDPIHYVAQSRFVAFNHATFANALVWIAAEMYAAELSAEREVA